MTGLDLTALLGDSYVRLGAVALAVLTLIWVARRVRRSERPDEPLSNLGMLIGLGWSSEAVWTLTGPGGAALPTPIRVALFAVFEVILIVHMIRAKRNVKTFGHPGRSGRNAWLVAGGMSLVAVWTAHNFGEALLRLLVPILLTAMWWDGLVGEGARKRLGATSWRWTPRRLLLWLGAIEPGERDVETVHRERLTQQMTNLEFRRRHGNERQRERAARRLARLGLTADDVIIAEVRDRVDRAMWFESGPSPRRKARPLPFVPATRAASARGRRARHRSLRRVVCVTHPRRVIVAAQEPRQDSRATQDIDFVARVIKDARPELSGKRIAELIASSEPTVRRALRRTRAAGVTRQTEINGKTPNLEGAK
jgi:hypothetical protein